MKKTKFRDVARFDFPYYQPYRVCGNVFYVDSAIGADTAGSGSSPDGPFASIAFAMTQCLANNGDVIFVMPGHVETVAVAGGITCNVAGVTVEGVGVKNERGVINLSAVGSTIAVSAANVTFRNIRIATTIDAVVKVFNVTAAGLTLDTVDFVETAACACLQFLLTTAAGDDLTIQNCTHIQTQTAATALQEWIKLVGADRFRAYNNFISLKGLATANPANGCIVGGTTLCNDVDIRYNRLITSNSTGAIPLNLFAGTTGFVTDNRVASAKTAIAGQVACASAFAGENYACHVANKNGLLDPVVDA